MLIEPNDSAVTLVTDRVPVRRKNCHKKMRGKNKLNSTKEKVKIILVAFRDLVGIV